MAGTIIQATNINGSASPAVSLDNGDFFYELTGVSVTTSGSTAVGYTGSPTSIHADIHGSLFGTNEGMTFGSGVITVASTGSVDGGAFGISIVGGPGFSSDLSINGGVYGAGAGIAQSGSTLPTNIRVSASGSVTSAGRAINLSSDASVAVDGTVSGVDGGISDNVFSAPISVQIFVSSTGSVRASDKLGIGIDLLGNALTARVAIAGNVYGGADGIDFGSPTATGPAAIWVGDGGVVAGNSGRGIFVGLPGVVEIDGRVSGGTSGIALYDDSAAARTNIAVGSTGVVTGVHGLDVTVKFGTPRNISNAGSIIGLSDGSANTGIGVFSASGGSLVNTGTITGAYEGIRYQNDPTSNADALFTLNTGTISGAAFSYDARSWTDIFMGTERFINQGTLNGDVGLGSHAASSFVNAGTLNGGVVLGNGAGQMVDSTLGFVSGPITCGSGGDTVVAGLGGGTVNGAAGNDILYANPTQMAADNTAHTTLDGKGGTNALYGGGGYNLFMAGTSNGGYNQIWGAASKMSGVSGYTNNTISFANAGGRGVYVDLLNGHNAYVSSSGSWTGTGVFEDAIAQLTAASPGSPPASSVPNVIGSPVGDTIQCDSSTDRITGGGGADALYAGGGQDTFIYTAYGDSNLNTGYDTIVNFKLGTDRIDLSALHTDGSHLAISTSGTSNTLYVEQTPGTFNAATDLAMIVNTTTAGGLHPSDFIF
jgi:hypothetical protein